MKSDSKGEKENPTVKHNRMNINIDLGTGNQQSESKHKQLETKHEKLEFKHQQLANQERETACNLRKTKENFEFCGVNDWNGLGTECVCCNMNKEGCADIQGPIEMKFDGHDTCFCKNTTPNPNEVTAVAVEK